MNNKCWRACGEKGTLLQLWECNWYSHCGESLKKVRLKLPYDPTILLPGTYPEKPISDKDTCIPMFTTTLFTTARTWKQTDVHHRWMDNEAVEQIYKGLLFNQKKECIWVGSNEVDEPRADYREWSKSEKQISYINAYIWNLERWCWWTHLYGSNGDTDTENRLVDTGRGQSGRREWDKWRVSWKHIHYHM